MSSGAFLSTAEVARRLGVKPATVYAYASRGLLTAVRSPSHRGSTFAVAEVDLLAQRGRAGRSPVGAVEKIRTSITTLDEDDLYYRAHRVVDLATTTSFEAVADLLWTTEPAQAPGPDSPAPVWPQVAPDVLEQVSVALAALPSGASLSEQARVGVVVLGALDTHRFDASTGAVTRAARTTLGALAATLGTPARSVTTTGQATGPAAGLARRLWPALTERPAGEPAVETLNAAMILLADHGLAVSTLAARLAASARADIHAVIGAGLATAAGQHHAGASIVAHELLTRALDDPAGAIAAHLRVGDAVPGFGHRVYRRQDPRAELLLQLLPDSPATRAVDALCEHLAAREDLFPTIDLALAAFVHTHALRADAGPVLFEISRIVGWVAHALEEYAEPGLRFRSLGIYTGQPPRNRPRPPTR